MVAVHPHLDSDILMALRTIKLSYRLNICKFLTEICFNIFTNTGVAEFFVYLFCSPGCP